MTRVRLALLRLRRLRYDERAATAVEYAVMLGLILVAVIGAVWHVGGETGGMFGFIQTEFDAAGM